MIFYLNMIAGRSDASLTDKNIEKNRITYSLMNV